eukprot:CAMPEP_0181083320 /NCGR_PEP_ID=MMETSP1071-20121207/4095_1 /TAXON_ID=35127 /ORGANISM="Thalassiosira sp., Strain NH16" /LENGTH=164 /DNA_ID=CAMNT_0023164971 /DNA_START=5 /DNA_END=499 /DNA_ORIENTATION=+
MAPPDQAKMMMMDTAAAPGDFCRVEPRFGINTKGVWTSLAARSTSAPKPTKCGATGCPCCIGPPDTDFEEAYQGILDLGIGGMTSVAAQKFVRLCTNDRATMRLSKKKGKAAARLTHPPLSGDDVARMQRVVLVAYRMTRVVTAPASSGLPVLDRPLNTKANLN